MSKNISGEGPAPKGDGHGLFAAGESPLQLVHGLATAVKDGLRTARYGTAKIARKIDDELSSAPRPKGVPAELDIGLRTLGQAVKRFGDVLNGMERSVVGTLLPDHHVPVSFAAPGLGAMLHAPDDGAGLRSGAFTRFFRVWTDVYLRGEGCETYLLRESAVQRAGDLFREAPLAEASAQWAAQAAAALIACAPIQGLMPQGGGDAPAGLAGGEPNAATFLTLGLALAIGQGASAALGDDAEILAIARNLVAVEGAALRASAADPERLGAGFARLVRLV